MHIRIWLDRTHCGNTETVTGPDHLVVIGGGVAGDTKQAAVTPILKINDDQEKHFPQPNLIYDGELPEMASVVVSLQALDIESWTKAWPAYDKVAGQIAEALPTVGKMTGPEGAEYAAVTAKIIDVARKVVSAAASLDKPDVLGTGSWQIPITGKPYEEIDWHFKKTGAGWSTWNYDIWIGVERVDDAPVISACSWAPGRLDVFSRSTNNALWHKWYDTEWSDWEDLGGQLTSGPAAASWAEGRLDVFARGIDNALWHKWYDGAWSDWEYLGGVLTSAPAASSWGDGRLDTFVRGTSRGIAHKAFDGAWSDWDPLPGSTPSAQSAACWSEGRLDLFVRGDNQDLVHKWWFDGAWSEWESLGGVLTSAPAAASWAEGRLDVFVRSTDNALWHKWFDGAWSDWESLGGNLT